MRDLAARLLITGLALMSALAPAGRAAAASTETTPVAVAQTEVQVWPGADPGSTVVIVGATVPPETALPVRVRVPVPATARVDWTGEIGAQVSDDMPRPARIVAGTGGDYAEFDLVGSRQGQLDASGLPLVVQGGRYTAAFTFVQTVESPLTSFSVRVPAGARDVEIKPAPVAEPQRNESGEALYTLPSVELAAGESQAVEVSYALGSAASGGGSSTGAVVGALAVVLAVAVAGLLFVMRRRAPAAADEMDDRTE